MVRESLSQVTDSERLWERKLKGQHFPCPYEGKWLPDVFAGLRNASNGWASAEGKSKRPVHLSLQTQETIPSPEYALGRRRRGESSWAHLLTAQETRTTVDWTST